MTDLVMSCPTCATPLDAAPDALTCAAAHRFAVRDGYVDLVGDTERDSVRRLFDGAWGAAYDRSVKNRRYSTLVSPVWQGAASRVMREMYTLMDETVDLAPGQVVVDLPCGGGPVLGNAATGLRGRYVGVDLSPGQLRRAVRYARRQEVDDRVTFVRADARTLPFPDAALDRVCSFNGLHVVEDRAPVLAEVRRCLVPGGTFVGSTLVVSPKRGARRLHPWFFCLDLAPAQTRAQLEQVMADAGFDHVGIVSDGPILVFRAQAPGA